MLVRDQLIPQRPCGVDGATVRAIITTVSATEHIGILSHNDVVVIVPGTAI